MRLDGRVRDFEARLLLSVSLKPQLWFFFEGIDTATLYQSCQTPSYSPSVSALPRSDEYASVWLGECIETLVFAAW